MVPQDWEEQARWLKEQLPGMRFTLDKQYNTVCTVWLDNDEEGDKWQRIGDILFYLFGAYLCAPISNNALMGPTCQSFGFRTRQQLEEAWRILPLPAGLQPGEPVYINL